MAIATSSCFCVFNSIRQIHFTALFLDYRQLTDNNKIFLLLSIFEEFSCEYDEFNIFFTLVSVQIRF